MYIRRPSIIHLFLSSTSVRTKFLTAFLVKLREKLVSERQTLVPLQIPCACPSVIKNVQIYKLLPLQAEVDLDASIEEEEAKCGKIPSEDGQEQNSPSCVLGVIKGSSSEEYVLTCRVHHEKRLAG